MIRYRSLKITDQNRVKKIISSFEKFLKSGFYLNHNQTKKFEKLLAKHTNRKYVSTLSSGSSSLYLALKSLELQSGDEVICPAISWIASSSVIAQVGAKPVFVDTNLDQLINIDELSYKISNKTKAVIVVNFLGKIPNYSKIEKICKKNNLFLIEDAAQSFGASRDKRKSGNFGDISTFSFNPMKVMQGFGEGGGISTNNKKIFNNILNLKHLGTSYKNPEVAINIEGNHKFDELHAYLLMENYKNLNIEINARKKLINYYLKLLKNKPYVNYLNKDYKYSTCYDFQVIFNGKRDSLKKYLLRNSIETRVKHPIIMPHQKIFKNKFTFSQCRNDCEKLIKFAIT